MEKTPHILVVDDEEDLCSILSYNLEAAGYQVTTANSAEEALKLHLTDFDLLLLDVMMGAMSGFEMAQRLKQEPQTAHIPIIFLTAKDSEGDTVKGLNLGADDYISKPFSLREVLARIKAVLRRTALQQGDETESHTLTYEGIVIDTDKKTVSIDGREVKLTKTEYNLLALLLAESDKVFSREELIRRLWPHDVVVFDRTVDVNITRLRKKIAPYSNHIVTRLGFGYYFET